MGDTAAHAVFGFYTAALVATACIALTSSLQFVLIGLRQKREGMYLSYAALCLCIAVLSCSNALLGLATDVGHAVRAMRILCSAAVLYFPPFFVFIGHYTGQRVSPRMFGAVTLIAVFFLGINLALPATMLFSQISGLQAGKLPWGEWISKLSGVPSPIGWSFHILTYAAFSWAMAMAAMQFRRGERLAAALLGSCLIIQLMALLWGDIVVDMLGHSYPYLDAFSFLSFVLLMSLSMATQLYQRTIQLERTTRRLRDEAQTRQQAELSLRHLAFHDALTGLPNRLRVLDQMTSMALEAQSQQRCCAVLVIDLDNFKTINDALGHQIGDRVLETVADRLVAVAPPSSIIGRLGGDEFVVVLDMLPAGAEEASTRARQVALNMTSRLASPINVDSRILAVGASIGVAVFSSDDRDAADVIRRANIALYRAKDAGRNTIRLFEPQMQGAADARLELERGLRSALEQLDSAPQFSLHFQPKRSIAGILQGAEVLLRWNHPTLGDVSPTIFIPIAEETGLIHTLGTWVIAEACARIRDWDTWGIDFGGHLAVNVSAWQIAHPDFARQTEKRVRQAGIDPGRITLELTESALLQDFETALATMQTLADVGFRLALDDFGTGYSSLSYLRRLPLHELKIDRSFISSLGPDSQSPLAGFIVDIGKRLDMTVVAEGVETASQMALLEAMGCDVLQGYLICRPLPEDAFLRWLAPVAMTSEQQAP